MCTHIDNSSTASTQFEEKSSFCGSREGRHMVLHGRRQQPLMSAWGCASAHKRNPKTHTHRLDINRGEVQMKRALPVVQSRSAAEAQSIASEDVVGEAESVLGAALRRCVSAAPLSLPRSFSLPDIHTQRTRTSARIHAHARTHSLCYSLSLCLSTSLRSLIKHTARSQAGCWKVTETQQEVCQKIKPTI